MLTNSYVTFVKTSVTLCSKTKNQLTTKDSKDITKEHKGKVKFF